MTIALFHGELQTSVVAQRRDETGSRGFLRPMLTILTIIVAFPLALAIGLYAKFAPDSERCAHRKRWADCKICREWTDAR